MGKQAITQFSVTPYGEHTKFDDTKSIGRCRIFYRGKNRNFSYISDEFAEKLISTLPYTPVKGIYSEEDKDFTAHANPSDGRIYGVVPEKTNFAWEKHLDDDGVEREYACVDVIYYTGIYEEAGEINTKSQSMELYRPSIQGEWKVIDGDEYFVFEDASFLGLQVLGEKVEPCFEGASFFALYEELIKKIEDKEKEVESFAEVTEEASTEDAPAEEDSAEEAPVEEKKEDEVIEEEAPVEENVEVPTDDAPDASAEEAPVEDVATDAEGAPAASEGDEGAEFSEEVENTENFSTKISELEATISTLTMERDNAFARITELEAKVSTLTDECTSLSTYKKNIEDAKKLAVIDEYTDKLPEEILEKYRTNLDAYSEGDLDMHLFYEMKKATPNIFSANDSTISLIPKSNQNSEKSSIERILDRYEKH